MSLIGLLLCLFAQFDVVDAAQALAADAPTTQTSEAATSVATATQDASTPRWAHLAVLSVTRVRPLAKAAEAAGAVPSRLARVTEARFAGSPALGPPGSDRVFVTAADDIQGITSSQMLAERLTLLDDAGKLRQGPFSVSTFDTPAKGLGVPVFRTNPGFMQGGYTAGGAREFDLPNLLYEQLGNVMRRTVS